ncbi:MAG: hypothetical protein ACJAZ2_002407 [Glaciecola sp.]|jgi:hypothetical protein
MDYKNDNRRDDIFSNAVRAGKRTYFFDVKATKGDDYYLTITESKKRFSDDGKFSFEKHKLFLYKEDFEKFADGLKGAIDFIQEEKGVYEGYKPDENESETTSETSSEVASKSESATESSFDDINFEDLGSN